MITSLVLGSLRRRVHLYGIGALALSLLVSRPMVIAGTSGLPPELAPLTANYEGELVSLATAKARAITPAQQTYLAALADAAKKATVANKADEFRAVAEEKEAITAGRSPDLVASPLLPRMLASPRAALLHEVARVEREFIPRVQQTAAEYLRGLAFYEAKARTAGQIEVLKQI
jgi:hypothetical protein